MTFWLLPSLNLWAKTTQPWEGINPSIHPYISPSRPLIHPHTRLASQPVASQQAVASHLLFSQLFPYCSLLSFSFYLSHLFSLSLSLSCPSTIWMPCSSEQWAFPQTSWQRDNLGRRLNVSSSLASQPRTPNTHMIIRSGCHGEKLTRKISIWHKDWKHLSRTRYATVTLAALHCRRDGIVGRKRPVCSLKELN